MSPLGNSSRPGSGDTVTALRSSRKHLPGILALAALSAPLAASATEGGVVYTDVTAAVGVSYERTPSVTIANREAANALPVVTFFDIPSYPLKADGAPGVSILDYDNDGDLDFFVSNGPGTPHSLFRNQLVQTGSLSFVDVGTAAGVGAPEQDGTGSCFGDIDNDGDHDLLVLGRHEQHRLFLNNGDGTFTDLGAASGLGGGGGGAASCAMGDIDNDGLLDVAVVQTTDWASFAAIVAEPFALNIPNDLYLNIGDATFVDVSEDRGFRDLESGGMPPGVATLSWAVTMVDYDYDGDVDILQGDDQAAVPGAVRGGVDRGFTHIFENDGNGYFTNVTLQKGGDVTGHWMGFSWADYDCDGGLDFFNSDVGDYIMGLLFAGMPLPYQLGEWPSGWFMSNGSGWDFPVMPPDLPSSTWAWGSTALDYDNDGDADTLFHGGLHMGFFTALDNPGTLYQNQGTCSGVIGWDQNAIQRSHTRRGVEGVASGDLDNDGFPDVVSAAGFRVPDDAELSLFEPWGSPFDATAYKYDLLTMITPGPIGPPSQWIWEGNEVVPGDVVVEVNSGGNGNRWIGVSVLGTIELTDGGRVNRDGIGAIVSVTPKNGPTSRHPIAAGGPYASQDALDRTFGLGRASKATVEVLWPGGVRNRLDDVRPGERVLLPEIPCSYDDPGLSEHEFEDCVEEALDDLVDLGILTHGQAEDLEDSMESAFAENHDDDDSSDDDSCDDDDSSGHGGHGGGHGGGGHGGGHGGGGHGGHGR